MRENIEITSQRMCRVEADKAAGILGVEVKPYGNGYSVTTNPDSHGYVTFSLFCPRYDHPGVDTQVGRAWSKP